MAQVIIIGASRGIGLELVRQYRAEGAQVTATARSQAALAQLRELGAQALALDVADAKSSSGLAWQIDGARFDIAIVNAGVLGPRDLDALSPPGQADFDAVMHSNVLGRDACAAAGGRGAGAGRAAGADLVAHGLDGGAHLVGNGWLYRASKAALNSVLKDASLQLAGRAICIALASRAGCAPTWAAAACRPRAWKHQRMAEHPPAHRWRA